MDHRHSALLKPSNTSTGASNIYTITKRGQAVPIEQLIRELRELEGVQVCEPVGDQVPGVQLALPF